MNSSLTRFSKVAVGCLAVLCTVCAETAQADPPVIRTFGYLHLGNGVPPNFLGDDSRGVIVQEESADFAELEFSTSTDPDDEFDNSVWVLRPARHIMKGGIDNGGIYVWLETPSTPTRPPVGAFTLTGSDGGFIISQEVVYIAMCDGDCGFGDDGKWRFTDAGTGIPFVIVTAVFSR